tara:strand:- start:234 stop:542 length:309 start_codon:yes stop_codon:yes gene_type:complete
MADITPIKWENADFKWNDNKFTWDEVQLVKEIFGGGDFDEEIYKYDAEKKKRLISLTLKVYGNTITEKKQKEIKQYKIKAKDIRLVVKEVLGVEMVAEGVSF